MPLNCYPAEGASSTVRLTPKLLNYIEGHCFDDNLIIPCGGTDLEVPLKKTAVSALVEGKKVIDFGCADHVKLISQRFDTDKWFHKVIRAKSAKCIGIDVDQAAIAIAAKYGYEIFFYNIYTDDIPYAICEDVWDYITLLDVLEHIDDPIGFLKLVSEKFKGIVKKIIIVVPNAFSNANFLNAMRHFECINSDHRFWFTPYTLAKIIVRAGLSLERINLVNTYMPRYNFLRKLLLKYFPLLRDRCLAIAGL